jgi:hypothetical protein
MRVTIVDHYASLNYTHHTQSLLAHVSLLRRHFPNVRIRVLLPLGSEITSSDIGSPDSTLRVLIPLSHFARVKFNSPVTLLLFFFARFIKLAISLSTVRPFRLLKHSLFWISSSFTKVLLIIGSDPVIFPSACPQSLWIVQKLEKERRCLKVILKFTNTSEIRKPFGSQNEVSEFLHQASRFKSVKLVSSFESLPLMLSYGPSLAPNLKHVSRLPSTGAEKIYSNTIVSGSNIELHGGKIVTNVLIGGRPHDPDRQEFLKVFFSTIESKIGADAQIKNLEFTVVGQKQVYGLKRESSLRISHIPYRMPFYSLLHAMGNIDICVLPYSKDIYRLNNSSMVFLLADLCIPIITRSDCSFSADIKTHSLGATFRSPKEAAIKILTLAKTANKENFDFEGYQRVREDENLAIFRSLRLFEHFVPESDNTESLTSS